MATATVGDLLKQWRAKRGCSQLALASDAGVSTRHLSFVETGRSKPSPELLLTLAEQLDLPLRERNTLLLAGGYAPRFSHHTLDADAMHHVRSSLQRILDTHEPYPGLVLDRQWNIVMTNRAADRMVELLPPELQRDPINLFRASLHPDGFARYTTNLDRWAPYLLSKLDRLASVYDDPALHELVAEVHELASPLIPESASPSASNELVVTCDLEIAGTQLSLFTTLTSFGSPRDTTLDELLIELFFPADAETEATLATLAI